MNVFISWSGELSGQIANLLGSWIEDVLQDIKAWISTDDIDKGSLWFGDITKQLSETGVGILCLTQENMNAPWILFEAGALSKGLSKSRVCPLLINLAHTDLRQPLSQFNATLPNKDDMLKLVKTINAQKGDKGLSDDRVQKAFSRWWDEFDTKFKRVVSEYKPSEEKDQRHTKDMVAEILEMTRSLQKSIQQLGLPPVTLSVGPGTGKSFGAGVLAALMRQKMSDDETIRSSMLKALTEEEYPNLKDLLKNTTYNDVPAKHKGGGKTKSKSP